MLLPLLLVRLKPPFLFWGHRIQPQNEVLLLLAIMIRRYGLPSSPKTRIEILNNVTSLLELYRFFAYFDVRINARLRNSIEIRLTPWLPPLFLCLLSSFDFALDPPVLDFSLRFFWVE